LFGLLRLQGFYNALAGTTLPNPGSVSLHQAMGFQPVGVYRNIGFKCGTWHDVAWWQLALREPSTGLVPEPLVALPLLDPSPAWHQALQAGLALLL
jgi:phosphinothricin acetyltransferase